MERAEWGGPPERSCDILWRGAVSLVATLKGIVVCGGWGLGVGEQSGFRGQNKYLAHWLKPPEVPGA